MLLRRVLRAEPEYDVVEAGDGLAAWEMLQEGLMPALITLDIMMPRMDGLDLLARIRANHRLCGVKVIMCTAVNDQPHMTSANSLDIDGYILKPFTPKKILDQVRQVFDRGHSPSLADPVREAATDNQSAD
jgi:CheY-like chemotaxis protein